MKITSDSLVEAVLIWTGYGSASVPARNDESMAKVLSFKDGAQLLMMVRALEEDFNKSQASSRGKDLVEVGEIASMDFKRLHPELSQKISEAFEWCYTYDWK